MAKKPAHGPGSDEWYKSIDERPQNKQTRSFTPSKFVRSELSDQEKAHVKAQEYVWDDIPEHLCDLVEKGYKVSLTNDLKTNSYAVWITTTQDTNLNHGYTLSARGPTLLQAISVAIYKHYTKFNEVWPKDDQSPQFDQWG